MSKVGRWSATPGSNNATPPDGWPEGQAPSTVNDCAREMMAAIRTLINDAQYIDQDFTPTYISATTFSVPGNQTSAIHANRRIKAFDGATVYGTIVTASFTAVTTIQISADSGNLTSSLSSFALAILAATNDSLPRGLAVYQASTSFSSIQVTTSLSVGGAALFNGTVDIKGQLSCSASAVFNGSMHCASRFSGSDVFALTTTKAWANIRLSSGAVNLPTSYNVTSITDSNPGVYIVNITSSLSTSNYAVLAWVENDAANQMIAAHASGTTKTTAAYEIQSVAVVTTNQTDAARVYIGFFH